MTGERAAQQRADDVHGAFLSGSRTTLQLVNATLDLANKATERATHIIEEKTRAKLEQLDRESQALLSSVSFHDDRALVSDPALRSDLRSLAERINGFETNRLFLLEEDKFRLTPRCLFIRGMDFHLRQQFKDAIASWKDVALSQINEDQLKSSAWYWIGYEHNNLGEYEDARISFEKSLDFGEGARLFELKRIIIESRFFNKKESAAQLIEPLKELLSSIDKEEIDEEIEARKSRILTTLGNVYLQVGNELRKDGKTAEAKENYVSAKGFFTKASKQYKWALVGLADALYWSGEEIEARKLYEGTVREIATEEYRTREEPRTKAMARQTELTCCIRVPALNNEVSGVHKQVLESLGLVDARITVYSQMQKRDVKNDEFKKDLDELMRELQTKTG